LGIGKIRSPAIDWDEKMIKMTKKIILNFVLLFINL